MTALIWLAGAGVLFLLEWLFPEVDGLLIGGAAALVISALSALVPLPAPLQLVLFALLFAAGYTVLRRWLIRSRRQPDVLAGPGSERAEVIQPFDRRGRGRVRWQGQSWAAELLEPAATRPPAPGEDVVVLRRVGTRLDVLPSGSVGSEEPGS